MIVLGLSGVVLGSGCERTADFSSRGERTSGQDDASTSGKLARQQLSEDYYFRLKYVDAWGVMTLTVNGFPVHQSGGGHITDNPPLSIDLNTALVGEGNRVEVRAKPWIERRGGGGLDVGPVQLRGKVTRDYGGEIAIPGTKITAAEVESAYRAWVGRAEEKWREYRSRVEEGALDSMRAWASRHPMTVTTTFDNEHGPDFSRVFEEAPVLKDTPATRKRLKEYALRLRNWMAEKDTSALVEAFGPRMESAFKMSGATSQEQFRKQYTSGLVYKDAEEALAFGREAVGMRLWCGGRVWELFRKPGKPLLRRMEVYVAEIDGKLKVVR